jgi:outer membrane lipoprotein SlyB
MRARAFWSIGLAVILAACASPAGRTYSQAEAGRPWRVQNAKILDIKEATIEGHHSAIGTVGGGLIGYSLGRAVGGGTGARIAGAVAGVAGAVTGQQVEKAATSKKAYEILVDIENGLEQLVIVQPADQIFAVGEEVRVYTRADGSARVAKR